MKTFASFLILALAGSALADKLNLTESPKRNSKSFSIFSVVQFGNSLCVATSSTSTTTVFGTCFTSSECVSSGGTATGSCASGFGVCCVITQSTCGTTISKNVTYIQNPGWPSGYTATTACTYTLGSTSDICQIRLDFVKFEIGGPPTAAGATAGQCQAADRLVITSSSGSGFNAAPPITCGVLTGTHMYIETGRNAATGGTLTITSSAATNPARTWQIRATQIECGNPAKAPTDCLQYYTGVSGNMKSLNYNSGTGLVLQNMNYHMCIRQEEGFCSINYRQLDSATLNTFKLAAGAAGAMRTCANDELVIMNTNSLVVGAAISAGDVFCGTTLSTVISDVKAGVVTSTLTPFDVGVFTDNSDQSGTIGFNVQYDQVPC